LTHILHGGNPADGFLLDSVYGNNHPQVQIVCIIFKELNEKKVIVNNQSIFLISPFSFHPMQI